MKWLMIILFLVASRQSFGQIKTAYLFFQSKKLKNTKGIDVYYHQCDKLYHTTFYIPSTIFMPLYLYCDSTKPFTLAVDFKDDNLPVYHGNFKGDLNYFAGDSILIDIDNGICTITNLNRRVKK